VIRISGDSEILAELLDILRLGREGDDRFRAASPGWWGERLFGGMVVAQALSAACQCVEETMQVHSLHGYFFRPIVPGTDTQIVVERLRDGRSFATRDVMTSQGGKLAARMTCSFCVDEEGEQRDEYRPPMPSGLVDPDLLEISSPPGPIESVDAGPLRAHDGTYISSGRFWNRTVGPVPADPRTWACVLSLISDMTRTSFRPASLDVWGGYTDASIDHALWFHHLMSPDLWLFYDLQALVNAKNRATVRGSMYSRDGTLVLTMVQELLVRPVEGGVPAGELGARF